MITSTIEKRSQVVRVGLWADRMSHRPSAAHHLRALLYF